MSHLQATSRTSSRPHGVLQVLPVLALYVAVSMLPAAVTESAADCVGASIGSC